MKKGFALKIARPLRLRASMALALPLQALSAQDMPGKGKTIKMARATWDTGWWQAEIYKQLLEKLGYNVGTVTTLENPAFYQAVGAGRRRPVGQRLVPAPQHLQEAPSSQGAKEVGYVAKGGALQGYLIDKKTADKYDIKYLSDMKKPKIAQAVRHERRRQGQHGRLPAGLGLREADRLPDEGLRPAEGHRPDQGRLLGRRWPTRSAATRTASRSSSIPGRRTGPSAS